MKISLIILLCFLISCKSKTHKKKCQGIEITKIELVLSKYGRTMEVNEDTADVRSDELYQVYSIYLKGHQITTFKGYGNLRINTVSLNKIIDTKKLILNKVEFATIMKIAKKIYQEKEYNTSASPTDCWLIDLNINDKNFVFYRGENPKNENLDFIKIADLMVKNSPINIEHYP